MTLWTFAATILPPLLAALIVSGRGAVALSPRITTGSVVPVVLFGLLLFVAMVTFKRARGWNAALLVGFSFAAGGGGGVVVFGGRSATWFAGFDPEEEDPSGTAWAVDLYLLGLNLAIAARVLVASPGWTGRPA